MRLPHPGPVSAPMALTLARVAVLAPLAVLLGIGWSSAALALFIAGALTDALDGFLARRMGCATQAGAVADQIADKVFTSGTLILLTWAGAFPGPWVALPVALIAREFWVAGLRDWAARAGTPLPVGWLGKLKTLTLMTGLGLLIAWPAQPLAGHLVLLVALALALWSAVRYTRKVLASAATRIRVSAMESESGGRTGSERTTPQYSTTGPGGQPPLESLPR